MNWLTNFVRPRIRALVAPSERTETLWFKCPKCDAMIFHRELAANYDVCHHCGHHRRLPPDRRLAMLFDADSHRTIELPRPTADPLRFRDAKRYSERLREAQQRTARHDAIVVAHGTMGGLNAVVAVFDFGFMGGSMGTAVGEGLVAAADLAVLQDAALIAVPSTGGARMQEGMLSLMQMPRTVIAVDKVKEAGLPYIVVFADPTTGGVTASFAMLGDVHIAEPGATIGFAGARVIEETIRQTLPDGFQTAEYLLEHGMVDMVVQRARLRDTLIRVIGLLRQQTPTAAEAAALEPPEPDATAGPQAPGEPAPAPAAGDHGARGG
jgi:acetyl-CoA carboxylase carboxyl transferase subunit beta